METRWPFRDLRNETILAIKGHGESIEKMRNLQFHLCGSFKESYREELSLFRTDFGRLWVCIILVLLFVVVPLVGGMKTLNLFSLIGIYAMAALGLNILTGFTGQLSLAHGSLFGIGAYTTAILCSRGGFPFLITIPIAVIFTGAVGIILAFPAARLRNLYLCIATLGGQLILEYLFLHWKGLTGGAEGLTITTGESALLSVGHETTLYFVVFIALAILIWVAANLMRTRFGRAFTAIRDNETAAEGMGVPIFRYKVLSFAISSCYAGFAGALFAYHMGEISPGLFGLGRSMEFLAMIVAGGLGSIPGAVFGSVFIVVLNQFLGAMAKYFPETCAITAMVPIREFFYGGVIVLFITFQAKGISFFWERTKSLFRTWPL